MQVVAPLGGEQQMQNGLLRSAWLRFVSILTTRVTFISWKQAASSQKIDLIWINMNIFVQGQKISED